MVGMDQRPYSRQGSMDQSSMFQRPPSVGRAMMPGTPQYPSQPMTPSSVGYGGAHPAGSLPVQPHVLTSATKPPAGAVPPSYITPHGIAASAAFTSLQHAHPLNRPAHFGMS